MIIRFPFNGPPQNAEFLHGILKEEVCHKIKPLDWEAIIDSTDKRKVEQAKSWIASRTINILTSSPRVLSHIEPGFESQKTQDIFADLKKATKAAGKVAADLQIADQGVSAALAIQESNIDPSKVAQNRKSLKEQREALEDVQILAGTYERNLEYLWTQLFQSLQDFTTAQVAAMNAELEPIAVEVNAQIKGACQLWQLKGEPKLRRINEMNPAIPESIYYEHLHLTQLQIRQLKSFEAFPQIRINGNRFEFKLEGLGYVKK